MCVSELIIIKRIEMKMDNSTISPYLNDNVLRKIQRHQNKFKNLN